ncbi:cation:proton antiporter [Convivina praedatoris]|nr:cation:proton antiporter [Convivina sp. LMG 32447]
MNLIIVLLASLFFSYLANCIKLPLVVGQLVAGIVIGPALLNWVKPSTVLEFLAEIGLIALMFLAGLDSNLALLKRYLKPATVVALTGVVVPLFSFLYLGWQFHYSGQYTWLLAVLFSATSVSITAQVLSQYNRLDSVAGVTILGAAVVDDLLAVLMWAFYAAYFKINGASGSQPLWLQLMVLLTTLILLVVFLWQVMPRLINLINQVDLPGFFGGFCLLFLLGLSYLTEQVGLSSAITAFLIGLLLAQSSFKKKIQNQIVPFGENFLIPVFFVGIGLNITFKGQLSQLLVIVLMTLIAVFSKWLGAAAGAKIMKINRLDSAMIGTGMVSRGEMALVIANLALGSNVLTAKSYATLSIVILLTTIFTPIVLRWQLGINGRANF